MRVQVNMHVDMCLDGNLYQTKRPFETFEVEVDALEDIQSELIERYGSGFSAGSDGKDGCFDKFVDVEQEGYPILKSWEKYTDYQKYDQVSFHLCSNVKVLAEPKTTVIFRKYPDGDVLALMPYDIADRQGNCTSYMHIGQHGAADYNHCIDSTEPAIHAEYKDLADELTSLGYNLEIRRKANGRKQSEAFLESIRMRGNAK